MAIRLLTFCFLDPKNVDGHYEVVGFISQYGRLPHSGELGQAYHPPLYYLLAAPIYRWSGSFKVVQVLSLALSMLTLLVLYDLIYRRNVITSNSARRYSFLLACFLPQFVLYGLFVSNDTLTIFLGCCTAWCIAELVRAPDYKHLVALACMSILGLLTKATFVAYLPVLCCVVLFVWRKSGRSRGAALGVATAFLILVAACSSYKEIDNYRQYGHAFVSNIDFHPAWATGQRKTFAGKRSYVDVNFAKLLASPSYSPATQSAYPLMLYGTFWYQHVPESNFVGSTHRPFTWMAVGIYLFALLPTTAFLGGLFALMKQGPSLARLRIDDEVQAGVVTTYATAALLLANLAIMLTAVGKYHVWSIMQGRLLFPSCFGMLAVMSVGIERLEHSARCRRMLNVSIAALCVLFVMYLLGEMGLQVILRFLPGVKAYLRTMVR